MWHSVTRHHIHHIHHIHHFRDFAWERGKNDLHHIHHIHHVHHIHHFPSHPSFSIKLTCEECDENDGIHHFHHFHHFHNFHSPAWISPATLGRRACAMARSEPPGLCRIGENATGQTSARFPRAQMRIARPSACSPRRPHLPGPEPPACAPSNFTSGRRVRPLAGETRRATRASRSGRQLSRASWLGLITCVGGARHKCDECNGLHPNNTFTPYPSGLLQPACEHEAGGRCGYNGAMLHPCHPECVFQTVPAEPATGYCWIP